VSANCGGARVRVCVCACVWFLRTEGHMDVTEREERMCNSGKGSTYEVHTNGRDERLCESVVRETEEKGGLAYTRITNEEELEQVVTVGRDRMRNNGHSR